MQYRQFTILPLLALLLVSIVPLAAQDEATECEDGFRLFDHELLATDPVCIPDDPQRIITLGMPSFETLMSYGIQPLASPSPYLQNYALNFPPLADDLEGIQDLGSLAFANIEAIIEAEPDLIIGHEARFVSFYDDLSAVAPTLLYEFEHSGIWQDVAQFVAEIVNREDMYEAHLQVYNDRLEDFRASLGEREIVVSVIRIRPDALRLYVQDSFPGSVIADVGLVRPESQRYTSEEMLSEFGQTTFYAISLESIQLVDGDAIFIWTSSPTRELAEQSGERLQELVDDPLWGTLDAVQAGQVYEVGGHWIGSSFIAAHYLLDDLSLRLDVEVETPNPFKPEAEQAEDTDDE
ncbi:MAG: iron-siderophore ABC transporter substrate-binding protein [Chloroflexota bacterium]